MCDGGGRGGLRRDIVWVTHSEEDAARRFARVSSLNLLERGGHTIQRNARSGARTSNRCPTSASRLRW